jgi:hypothetical protein
VAKGTGDTKGSGGGRPACLPSVLGNVFDPTRRDRCQASYTLTQPPLPYPWDLAARKEADISLSSEREVLVFP